ncbi:MAG: aldehyde dehydrogenase family protein, partial [Acinetobacter sp.]|nr:aldehyde dehydrogenase family protein [Acinetobacter sp.]
MEQSTLKEYNGSATEHMELIFSKQRANFEADPYPSLESRRTKLHQLKKQIIRYQDALATAINADFSSRSLDESKLLDLLGSVLEADHAIHHLRRWMRPNKRRTELLFLSNRLSVQYQPKGVVGVIVPWNFPVYLALGPLIAALAAGNRVMIKLPEITPNTNAMLRRMLAEVFNEDEVAVFGEEITDPARFTTLPFNHIVFTGSPAIGKVVMRAAAENLTPVTLELGGKSPAIVSRNYPLADAAKRITHGKATNSGQICVAPDYALVPKESIEEFVDAAKSSFIKMFGQNITNNENYTSIVNDRHLKRIQDILTDAQAKGARVIPCDTYS